MIQLPEAEFAVRAVSEAAEVASRVQSALVADAITKEDRSPVTVADFAAQAVVARRLQESLSADTLIGEESADVLRAESGAAALEQIAQFVGEALPGVGSAEICDLIDAGVGDPPNSFWSLDPVDGTKGFLRGDQYAVALALVRDGQVEVGALACPELEEATRPATGGAGSVLVAARGQGAFTKPLRGNGAWKSLHVSAQNDVAQARLLRSVEKAHTNTGGIGELVAALGIVAEPVGMDSQAKYAVLASGGGEVNLRLLSPSRPDYREKVWDQAAGSIVVEEAGGRVSDLDGKPLDFSYGRTLASNRGVLATNGLLHEALLAGLQRIEA